LGGFGLPERGTMQALMMLVSGIQVIPDFPRDWNRGHLHLEAAGYCEDSAQQVIRWLAQAESYK
jgi:hypothetical protein